MAKNFDDALRALQTAHDEELAALRDQLKEVKDECDAAERAASEAEDDAANANFELNDARDDAKQLLEDKENLLRLLGLSEHEYDCEASRLRFADPAKFLHERLVVVAGL